MLNKNDRVYIRSWFDDDQLINEGDILVFEMPSFCSGDYEAIIYIDTDGDPYIDKRENHMKGCRTYEIVKK